MTIKNRAYLKTRFATGCAPNQQDFTDVFDSVLVPADDATGGDFLTRLTANEVSIFGTATAEVAKMHACFGTTTDYVFMLPPVAGNAGKLVGVRMASNLTKLVTVKGDGTELIDGLNTRVMWAGESAIFLCDGVGWTKIAGKSIPMRCYLSLGSTQSIPHAAMTTVALTAVRNASVTSMYNTAANNHYIAAKRPGAYQVTGRTYMDNIIAAKIYKIIIKKSGTDFVASHVTPAIALTIQGYVSSVLDLVAGDQLQLVAYQESGVSALLQTYAGLRQNTELEMLEIPTW